MYMNVKQKRKQNGRRVKPAHSTDWKMKRQAVICVCALRNVDRFADLTLCQIGILPQIADAPVSLHVYHQTQYT